MSGILFHFFQFCVDLLLLAGLFDRERRETIPNWSRIAAFSVRGVFSVLVLALTLTIPYGQYLAEGILFHGGGFLIVVAIIIWRRKRSAPIQQRKTPWITVSVLVMLGTLALVVGVQGLLIEPTDLQVVRYTISSPKLKEPVRIAFLADIQTDTIGPYERRTLETLRRQEADLVVLGGDYLQFLSNGSRRERERLLAAFNRLFREEPLEAPLGVYAVRGNHEYHSYYRWERLFEGSTVQRIRHTTGHVFEEQGLRLTLLSVERSFSHGKHLFSRGDERFHVMVGHAPNFAVSANDADLLLAGHTHGGQVRLPGLPPLITFAEGVPRSWCSGKTVLPNGATLIVSHGSGMERGRAPRIRLFCKPDIIVVDCVPEQE